MLIQYYWLSSLLFILSANAHAYPPAGLKPRYLATGTGVSLSSTATPPYPATGTGFSSNPTTSTAVPAPTPSSFYLVVADTGTPFDGRYIYVGMDSSRNGLYLALFGLQLPNPPGQYVFSLSANGTLTYDANGLVASYFDLYAGFIFQYPYALEAQSETPATCEIVGGELTCQNGAPGVFYAAPQMVIAEELTIPSLQLSATVPAGSYGITLLVVPT